MNKLILFSLITLISCASPQPWEQYPIKAQPDRTCSTGGMTAYNIYIWDCYNNQHITVTQYKTELLNRESIIHRVACGKLTPIEQELNLTEFFEEKCGEAPEWVTKR